MSIRWKILLVFSLHCYVLCAQLQVRNFYSLTGRRDLSVNVVVQEKTGHLLLGTESGIYRFDGFEAMPAYVEFQQLSTNITELYVARNGVLWIGTASGKVYSATGGRLDSAGFGNGRERERITDFYEQGGAMFVGTYGSGLFSFKDGKVQHYSTLSGLTDNVIYTITGDSTYRIWCGTDGGISELNTDPGKSAVNAISSKDGLPDNIVRRLHLEGDQLMVAMQDSGVCYYDPEKKQFTRNPFFAAWSLGPVLEARTLGPSLFIATERKGIIQITRGVFSVYKYEEMGLARINGVFFDDAQQLWVASGKGISRMSEKRVNVIGQEDGLTDNKVLAIAVDNNNVIWIGTAQGVSSIMTDDNGKIVVKPHSELSRYTISCAVKAPNGNMWFGTYGAGIIIMNASNGSHTFINSTTHQLPNDNISSIYFSSDGRIYVATLGGGLIKASFDDKNQLKIAAVYNEESGLGSNYVYSAVCDNTGKLYVATDGGGLEVLHNQRFINLTKRFRLRSNNVFSLCADKFNNIWAVSSMDGVLRYDRKRMRKFTRRDGLRDEQPSQIIAAGAYLYALHTKGIDKIQCLSGQVGYYDIPEETEPNLNAIALWNDRLYSGTNNGVLLYRTSVVAADSAKPTVFISTVTVNYRAVTDSITDFSYDNNNFAISFSGIWLKNPDKLGFRYRLAGLESDWQLSNEGKTVNYNNLRPGTYTFIAQARNEEDVWSDTVNYSFVIRKPFWQHWWFWVLVSMLVSAAVWLLLRYRTRALKRENQLLETRVKERTAQIEKQTRIIELKNTELEQLSLVASKTDNAVLILDPEGKLEYVNESFVRQHNMPLEHLRQRYGETIFELSNHDQIRDLVNCAVDNRRSVTYESQNKKEEAGKGTWQSSTLTPIFSEDGSLKKLIIIDTDVTERKKHEQIIFQKNKDMLDSISYAKKIQHAILPGPDNIAAHLPHYFCLYLTKDIVSGDFYWFSHLKDSSIIAAVDCTGHGVPGAFMSLIGYNLLNRIVNENRLTDPGQILFELNKGVIQALHKNDTTSRDGMDIAICKINHRDNTIEYAGAMRPLWIVNNGNLTELKADKVPIGTLERDRTHKINFTTRTVRQQPGDRYFIFTDGYADQFGGEKDKKYSTARFKDLLRTTSAIPLARQEEKIRHEHYTWKGDNEQIDDILLIGFETDFTRQAPGVG